MSVVMAMVPLFLVVMGTMFVIVAVNMAVPQNVSVNEQNDES